MRSYFPPSHHPFEPDEADIQKCAYFLWFEKGRPVGRDLDIWLEAKERLRHQHHRRLETVRLVGPRSRAAASRVRRFANI